MLIKNATIHFQPREPFPAVYCIIGQDPFQLNCFRQAIINTWKQRYDNTERIVFDLNTAEDWAQLNEEAAHYSFFATHRIFDARYDKKTLDAAAKKSLAAYLEKPKEGCLLLLTATELPIKALQAYASLAQVHIIQAITPNGTVINKWIQDRFQAANLGFDPEIPSLIIQYNEQNLLAIAQCVDKLVLTHESHEHLTLKQVESELIDQCLFVLYDLPKFCFEQNSLKAIQLLRKAEHQKQEPTLVLWILTQAIRTLLRLHELLQQKLSFQAAAQQLKLWSNQIPLFQQALQRYEVALLHELLQYADKLDKQLKTSAISIYPHLERIALVLCIGKLL